MIQVHHLKIYFIVSFFIQRKEYEKRKNKKIDKNGELGSLELQKLDEYNFWFETRHNKPFLKALYISGEKRLKKLSKSFHNPILKRHYGMCATASHNLIISS